MENDTKRNYSDPDDWLRLNNKTLRAAAVQKLPVEMLLNEGESFMRTEDPTIVFVRRRNKIAHGDYSDHTVSWERKLNENLTLIHKAVDTPPKDALDQLRKCSRFLIAWVGQNPTLPGFFDRSSNHYNIDV